MNEKLVAQIKNQIKEELQSSYLYYNLALAAEIKGFKGTAAWLKYQAKEEKEHAEKFIEHLLDRNIPVSLETFEMLNKDWKNHIELFEAVLNHEKHITDLIHKLMATASEVNDYAAQNLLAWFVDEQVEEEKNALFILNRAKMIGESLSGILYLDKELGKRGE
ncbi:MAG TPA: ferritin [Ignavibacteriales bacterium]|nr:ferritin [Ignavibacteriales bacterium]HOL80795.1 ferritin [Ignavibacteriales bacterium]HOM66190.1 ferritin [Ignavibacteriales bacterium]HPP33231.1 ferritin [Ignavibacteriales bacterium]HRR17907.1 ferritin [Ignavibacteriales bacterium]